MKGNLKMKGILIATAFLLVMAFAGSASADPLVSLKDNGTGGNVVPDQTYTSHTINITDTTGNANQTNVTYFNVSWTGVNSTIDYNDIVNVSIVNESDSTDVFGFDNNATNISNGWVNITYQDPGYIINDTTVNFSVTVTLNDTGLIDGKYLAPNVTVGTINYNNSTPTGTLSTFPANDTAPETVDTGSFNNVSVIPYNDKAQLKVNVSSSAGFDINSSTINLAVNNLNTSETIWIVKDGQIVNGTAMAGNDLDSSGNASAQVEVALQEGVYNWSTVFDVTDTNGNTIIPDMSAAEFTNFTVNMHGYELKVIDDSTHPLRGTNATIKVVALDKFENELIYNESDVNTSIGGMEFTFSDPPNTTLYKLNDTTNRPIHNYTTGTYNATYNVKYSVAGNLTITANDVSDTGTNDETLGDGSAVQTYTAPIGGVKVKVDADKLTANGQDTVNVTLQLTDGESNPVVRAGESVSWSIDNKSESKANVSIVDSMDSTDSNGEAVITLSATNSIYVVEVKGISNGYSATDTFETIPGNISAENSVLKFDSSANDPAAVKVATEHNLSAQIKDVKDNVVIGMDVTFSANDSAVSFGSDTVSTNSNGWANTTVTLPETVGGVSINATAGNFNASATGSAQLNVSLKAENATALEFNTSSRTVADGTSKTLEVKIVDEYGNINTTSGKAITLESSDTAVLLVNGSKNKTLSSSAGTATFNISDNTSDATGSATLTANASGLTNVSDTWSIGAPSQIIVTFSHPLSTSSQAEDTATMYAQLQDSEGHDLGIAGENITFTRDSGDSAKLNESQAPDYVAVTNETGCAEMQVNATSNTGQTTFKAFSENYTASGTGTITTVGAADSIDIEPGTTSPSATANISLTVTYRDADNNVVPKTDEITVKTDHGNFTNDAQTVKVSPTLGTTTDAVVYLNSTVAGTANITAYGGGVNGEVQVTFTAANVSLVNFTMPTEGVAPFKPTVTATLNNTGVAAGDYNVTLWVDGSIMCYNVTTVPANATETVEFAAHNVSAGTYNVTVGNEITPILQEKTLTVTPVEKETVPDNVNDTKEQVVAKYNATFDWTTQTPDQGIVVDSVTAAVHDYFAAKNPAEKQEIVNDVTTMVKLYFSLGG